MAVDTRYLVGLVVHEGPGGRAASATVAFPRLVLGKPRDGR